MSTESEKLNNSWTTFTSTIFRLIILTHLKKSFKFFPFLRNIKLNFQREKCKKLTINFFSCIKWRTETSLFFEMPKAFSLDIKIMNQISHSSQSGCNPVESMQKKFLHIQNCINES